MDVLPIRVTDEGVIIPKTYLHNAGEVEVEITDKYVIVRPKQPPDAEAAETKPDVGGRRRYSFIGIARSRNPKASVEVKEILER